MRPSSRLSIWLLPAVIFCLVGCGSETRVSTVPASGVVTFQGKPVADAEVVFLCDSAPRAAHGTTDANGEFVLMTYEEGDGAVPGTHKVTVSKTKSIANQSNIDAADPSEDYGAAMDAAGKGDTAKLVSNDLPAKYADPAQSALEYTVTESGPNEFEIVLD